MRYLRMLYLVISDCKHALKRTDWDNEFSITLYGGYMLRTVSEDELKEITEMFVTVFNKEPWNDKWTMETAGKRLLDIMKSPGFYGNAKYENDELVGFILGQKEQWFDGMHFQILELCTDIKYQGKGYGKEMLTGFMENLKAMDIKRVFLLTAKGIDAEKFYQKHGFDNNGDMIVMSNSNYFMG